MTEYIATIGLEIHAELKTHTKMFCNSINDADEMRANINICPVCMAHPGTLPVINKQAVKSVLRVGLALGSRLADYTEFDRKNYFYPDLPKGYQLSQFAFPLVSGGTLNGVEVTRIHLEEDTASSTHDDETGATLIDYNRAGVPLMELVTEPVMHSAKEAGDFGRELQMLLKYLGVSHANMEKGEMRVEANVSVAPVGERSVGYVEIKNLNSFRTMEKAVEYEIKRQTELVKNGGVITKQTLGWDENKQETFVQRTKEGAADYRYFPDPDLPSLKLSEIPEFRTEILMSEMPELPSERRVRYQARGLKPDDTELYVKETLFGDFFDSLTEGKESAFILSASNYLANDVAKLFRDSADQSTLPISVEHFSKIISLLNDKKISSRSAKDLLALSIEHDTDPEILATEHNLFQNTSTDHLESVVKSVLENNQPAVAEFKAGKVSILEFLVGKCMKELRGAADADTLRGIITNQLVQ